MTILFFAITTPQVIMISRSDDSGSGYVYLKANAYISTGAKIWINIVIPAIIGLFIFGLVAWFDPFGHSRQTKTPYGRRSSYYYDF